MQNIMGYFIPSESELTRAAAHLRSLTAEGMEMRCYFLPEIGKFRYHNSVKFPSAMVLEIPEDTGIGYESMEHTPAQVREEIITAVKMARS